jgi:hypothetical protein
MGGYTDDGKTLDLAMDHSNFGASMTLMEISAGLCNGNEK